MALEHTSKIKSTRSTAGAAHKQPFEKAAFENARIM